MARYRLVFKTTPDADQHSTDFIEATTAAEAIATMGAKHEHFELLSIRVDSRDPLPATAVSAAQVASVLEQLARALLRENTVLIALLNQPVFAASLTPSRLASLHEVTIDAQLALTAAQQIGVVLK